MKIWYPNKNIVFFILIVILSRYVLIFFTKRPQAKKSWGHVYG